MTGDLVVVATVVAAVGSGASGGVFLAFSTFVMRALGRLPTPAGLAAMQAINVTAVNPLFMAVLFGTGAVALGLAAAAVVGAASVDGARLLLGAGGALHVVGVVGTTAAFHVPRNDALAALDPTDAGSDGAWRRYLVEWTAGNHVRTAAGLAAAACFAAALRVR